MCAAALCGVALTACGGGSSGSSLDDALGYLPSDAPAAIAVSTDLDSGSFKDLDIALQRFGLQGGVEGALEDALGSESGVSFTNDIKPLLGNDLVVGLLPGSEETGPRVVASIQVTDGGKLEDLLNSIGLHKQNEVDGATVYSTGSDESNEEEPEVAVDGDTAVAAESPQALRAALDQRDSDGRLTEETFDDRLGDLPDNGILRATGELSSAIDALGLEQVSGVPWIASLKSFGVTADVSGRTLTADALVSTDEVSDSAIPIAPGEASPALVQHRPALGNRDQSQTLRFALDLVRASVPAATFSQIRTRLERAAHGSLGALADQFGEGLLIELKGDETVGRSVVKDPKAVATVLSTLSSEVPQVARAATEGGEVGDALEAAHTFIPALPIPEEGFFPEGSKVTPVPGQPDLYELAGPAPRLPLRLGVPGPPSPAAADKFYFGLIGNVFVTAPTLAAAREAASSNPQRLDTPPGSLAFSVPLRTSDLDLSESGSGEDIALTTVRGGIEASASGLRLRIQAGL